jgi:hypothetical protein
VKLNWGLSRIAANGQTFRNFVNAIVAHQSARASGTRFILQAHVDGRSAGAQVATARRVASLRYTQVRMIAPSKATRVV